jgi:hypothetical protein
MFVPFEEAKNNGRKLMIPTWLKTVAWICALPMLIFARDALAANYVVSLADMTVFNGVCHGPRCTDDDYISLTVEGPNGQSWTRTFGPNQLHKGNVTKWALSSAPINAPQNTQSQLTITWVAINKGHGVNADTLRNAADIAATVYTSRTNEQQSPGQQGQPTLVDAVIQGIKSAVDWVTKDCDTELFRQRVVIDGATLSNLAGHDGWQVEPEEHSKLFKIFDFPNIHSPCATGHYNLKVEIQPG